MPESSRYFFIALGLAAGLLVSPFLYVPTISWFGNPQKTEHRQDNTANNEADGGGNFLTSRLSPYVSTSDTLAQWIMAGLSIVATGASIWAVYLLYKTLIETREAVDAADAAVAETRRIGEAQVRAYVVPEKCVLEYVDMRPVATVHFRNCGQTPAENVVVSATVVLNDLRPTHLIYVFDDKQLPKGIISASGPMTHKAFMKKSASIDGLHEGKKAITVGGDITYSDVFKRRWTRHFEFTVVPVIGLAPSPGEMLPATVYLPEREEKADT